MNDLRSAMADGTQHARESQRARRDSVVRCDRLAWPSWRAIPAETRSAIEAAIPDGCHLTLIGHMRVGNYTGRLFRDGKVVAQVERYRYVEDAALAVLAMVGVTV